MVKMGLGKTEKMVVMYVQTPEVGLPEYDMDHFASDVAKIATKYATLNSFDEVIPGRRFNYEDDRLEHCGDFEDGNDIYPLVAGTVRVFMGFKGKDEKNCEKAILEFLVLVENYGLIYPRVSVTQNYWKIEVVE